MSGSKSITSTVDGQTHTTADGDCKTKGVIYAAECRKCAKQYVGQTITPLRIRITGHRGWMEKNKEKGEEEPGGFEHEDEGALAEHLKDCQKLKTKLDVNKGYKFRILTKNPTKL